MSETTAPNPEKIPARLLAAIVATGLMTFSGVVGETAMNVTFPTLMKEFSVGTSAVQWLTTGYLLVLALIVPLSTFLKKTFATKTLFVSASIIFITGTLMGRLRPTLPHCWRRGCCRARVRVSRCR